MDGIEERPANRVRSWPRAAPSGAAPWGNSPDARAESATRKRDHRRGRRISVRRTTRAASSKIGSSMSPIKGRWPRQPAAVLAKLCHQEHNGGHLPLQGLGTHPQTTSVCMILPGGGSRLQTLGGLASQWFNSTLRTSVYLIVRLSMKVLFN